MTDEPDKDTVPRRSLLDDPVLVLNKVWAPIALTTVRRAIFLTYQDAARVVCPETFGLLDFQSWVKKKPVNGSFIQTVNLQIPIMEIVWLTRYGGIPHRELAFTKKNLFLRDGYTCQYCLRRLKSDELTMDHIIPRSRGGTTDWENCVTACKRCNKLKGNRLLSETNLKLARPPIRPRWDLSFFLSAQKMKESWKTFLK